MKGLGYISVTENNEYKGPINKYLPDDKREELIRRADLKPGCVIFFIADDKDITPKLAGQIRTELGERLNLIDEDAYKMCFIVDFPMGGIDEDTLKDLCAQAIADNQSAVVDYLSGKEKALKAILGAVMKATRGRADAVEAEKLLIELIRQ